MATNNDNQYLRNFEELEGHACKWWPKEVRDEAEKASILSVLLETQDKFISLLKLMDKNNIDSIYKLIDNSNLTYTMFLKHLVVFTDLGSEPLQRINKNFNNIFPNGILEYNIKDKNKEYKFHCLPVKGVLNNKKMRIDTKENLRTQFEDVSLQKDIIMILLFGAASLNPSTRAILYKCTTYEYLGNSKKIEEFVKQNYIRVSRIIGGRTASDLGNVAQTHVVNYLNSKLGTNYCVRSNGTIPKVTQNDGKTLTTFDIVVDRKDDTNKYKKYVAIEVTFQETSNSTIERKGGQAADRFKKIASNRDFIAYIIDGAGNFSRKSAIEELCSNSHCTVAYAPGEFDVLVKFIKEKIG